MKFNHNGGHVKNIDEWGLKERVEIVNMKFQLKIDENNLNVNKKLTYFWGAKVLFKKNRSFKVKTWNKQKNKLWWYIDGFENLYLKITIKVFKWGVWVNFINKINEQIKFELRNIHKQIKIWLFEEDKTLSSRNLKIYYFEVCSVKFCERKMDK